jgi:hypothetical protein
MLSAVPTGFGGRGQRFHTGNRIRPMGVSARLKGSCLAASGRAKDSSQRSRTTCQAATSGTSCNCTCRLGGRPKKEEHGLKDFGHEF